MADEQNPQSIPYDRFAAVNQERNQYKQQLEESQSKYHSLTQKLEQELGGWQQKYQALESQHQDVILNHTMDKTVLTDGVDDPDVIDFLKYKYKAQQPTEGQAVPGFADWYAQYKEGQPAILAKYLQKPTPTTTPISMGQKQPAIQMPLRTTAPKTPAPQSGSGVSYKDVKPEDLKRMDRATLEGYIKWKATGES